jgi:glycosyltransferase involved in cell wall biosynthesis
MISVLINAYACAPNTGSEPGMAWNWITNLANYCKVYVITEGEWQSEIELALKELPQAHNIVFFYNPVSDKIRKICWNQGDWRFYYYYKKWQKSTLVLANKIIKEKSIDVIHQLNMIGFREPGFLWEIKKKPFIWGPLDAKEKFPVAYLEGSSIKSMIFIHLKNVLTYFQLRFSYRVKTAILNSSFVVSASSDSVKTVKKFFDVDSVLLNETGCSVQEVSLNKLSNNFSTLHLLWIGKFEFRKQLKLALQTLSSLRGRDIVLHIVGGDDNLTQVYKSIAEELKISNKCIWYGKIPHSKVQELMQSLDLFFFTSVAEGTPHVVLEAISNQLPVVCFDVCGQGDSVNETVGIKISLSNPLKSIADFSSKIEYLYNNRDVLKQLSDNCIFRQSELSWDTKAKTMFKLYKNAIQNFN